MHLQCTLMAVDYKTTLCVSLSFSEGDNVKITEANIRRKNLQSDRTGKDVRSEWEIIPF